MTAGTFDRTLAQRFEALELANEIRSRRAVLKRDVKTGRVSVLPLLADPPWWVESMKAWDLLLAVPKVGRVKAGKVLRATGISPSKTLSGLSDRQRRALVAALDGRS